MGSNKNNTNKEDLRAAEAVSKRVWAQGERMRQAGAISEAGQYSPDPNMFRAGQNRGGGIVDFGYNYQRPYQTGGLDDLKRDASMPSPLEMGEADIINPLENIQDAGALTEQYYDIIGKANYLAKEASSQGWRINQTNISDPNKRALSEAYQAMKSQALELGNALKGGYEVADGLGDNQQLENRNRTGQYKGVVLDDQGNLVEGLVDYSPVSENRINRQSDIYDIDYYKDQVTEINDTLAKELERGGDKTRYNNRIKQYKDSLIKESYVLRQQGKHDQAQLALQAANSLGLASQDLSQERLDLDRAKYALSKGIEDKKTQNGIYTLGAVADIYDVDKIDGVTPEFGGGYRNISQKKLVDPVKGLVSKVVFRDAESGGKDIFFVYRAPKMKDGKRVGWEEKEGEPVKAPIYGDQLAMYVNGNYSGEQKKKATDDFTAANAYLKNKTGKSYITGSFGLNKGRINPDDFASFNKALKQYDIDKNTTVEGTIGSLGNVKNNDDVEFLSSWNPFSNDFWGGDNPSSKKSKINQIIIEKGEGYYKTAADAIGNNSPVILLSNSSELKNIKEFEKEEYDNVYLVADTGSPDNATVVAEKNGEVIELNGMTEKPKKELINILQEKGLISGQTLKDLESSLANQYRSSSKDKSTMPSNFNGTQEEWNSIGHLFGKEKNQNGEIYENGQAKEVTRRGTTFKVNTNGSN